MELSASAVQRGGFARRAAPICCGVAGVAAAGFLATHDPGAVGARYPACVFHQATGLWCPGCGLTRGTYQLLHGHLGAALGYNLLTPLAIAAVVTAWFAWLRMSWGATSIRVPQGVVRTLAVILPALLIAYGVLRNIPAAPFRSLAP